MGLAKKLDKDQSSFTASGGAHTTTRHATHDTHVTPHGTTHDTTHDTIGSKGTLGWQAPEILAAADEAEERREEAEETDPAAEEAIRKRVRVTKKVDIFSMGTPTTTVAAAVVIIIFVVVVVVVLMVVVVDVCQGVWCTMC